MKITKEEFEQEISEIGSLEDAVQMRTRLVDLKEKIFEVYDDNASLTKTNETLTTDNEVLKQANRDMFLKIPTKEKPTPNTSTPEVKEMKYEDLFDEKGGLK